MAAEPNMSSQGFSETDIVFECPQCGKSLAIDEQGAGLVVTCPDCGVKMQVPIPENMRQEAVSPGTMTSVDYTEAVEAPSTEDLLQEKVQRLQVTMEEVQLRKRYLEKIRIDHALRFERIREEMAIVQAALDRMTDLMQDVQVDRPHEV